MADITLGMWTSHGPTLGTKPENWTDRVEADKANPKLWFRGKSYDFDSLRQLRQKENLARECTVEERRKRHARCQAAIEKMADIYEESSPDIAVIMGNDQHELFLEDVIPAFTVFTGKTFYNEPTSEEQAKRLPPGIHEAAASHNPEKYTEYDGVPELAEQVVEDLIEAEFDVANSKKLPEHPNHKSRGIPHAFGFIIRKIMRDNPAPILPIIANTFFPPNQPKAKRCFDLGKRVGRTILEWDKNVKVAVFGSGGMSHFVIDEDFDATFFSSFRKRNFATLTSIEETYFQSGTSELKNWITAAGTLSLTDLDGEVVEYQPCYRSDAGTGTANGFVYWK